ncbi:MAG: ATP-binding protein [Syntrophaceae bacterium]|nr:ATP-binding protein [Syntrophaceae bacterium]
MNQTILKNMISQWLEEFTLPAVIHRDAAPDSAELRNLSEILAIVGPRRAGKTFVMYEMIANLVKEGLAERDDILFLDFEDYRLRDFAPEDIENLFTIFRQLTGKDPAWLFFDEIHQLTDWSRIVRSLHNRGRYRIVISGSNARLLLPDIATELRGRYRDHLILPFSFIEILREQGISWTERTFYTAAKGDLLRTFDRFLKVGGFPEVLKKETPGERRQLLQNYYQTIFYRDIVERYNIRAKALMEGMMTCCLHQFSTLFSLSAFEKSLKSQSRPGSKRTLANYLSYLHEAFFILCADKFSYSPRQRVMNPQKIFLMDQGFTTLTDDFSENKGRILENVVAVELYRQQQAFHYYKHRWECDFIVRNTVAVGGNLKAIQVCWTLTTANRERELRGLSDAMEKLSISHGLILTYDEEESVPAPSGRQIEVMPVWKWLLYNGTPKELHGDDGAAYETNPAKS